MADVIKNCNSCSHLDYYEKESYESFSSGGHFCQKRNYRNELDESRHLKLLQKTSYLEAPKKCCEFVEGVK